MSKILGIDLGTTNSAMAVVEGGVPKILENSEGGRTTPSITAVSKAGDRLIGLLAKRQTITNSKNTIYSVKRLIGRRYDEAEVQEDKKFLPYEIRAAGDSGIEIKVSEKWLRPAEISAMILQKLKQDAEAKLGGKVEEAIITVPAYFNDSQRKATKDAGEIAGFKVKRILNEPTAAALAYGFDKRKNEQIVVYDFGGGTFDVSVLEVGDDVIEVKSTDGNTHLGGDDFDRFIMNWVIKEFKKESGIDISKDQLALQRLKESAEKAKHELSSTFETEINIPFITSDSDGPRHLLIKMTRVQLELLVKDFIDKSIEITERAVKAAGFNLRDIEEIILVGGQTRMPAMQKAVKDLFGKEPNKSINPDEVVAMGAAIQAGILQGEVRDVLLLDVTPLSLGIETLGGIMTRVMDKNTTIPVSRSQVFSTAADGQTSVEIHVLQGEREMAQDNRTLGRFILDGIPPSPRGLPQIEVTFDIDANGILSVKAKDKATGKEQVIRIEASSDLSKEQVEKMKQEAQLHTEEDKKKREAVEIRNNVDALIYSAEKSLKDAEGKISEDIKKSIQEKIDALKKTKDSDNSADIKLKMQELSQEIQKIGTELYKQSGQGAGQQNQQEQKPDDNVRDADYEEDDKNKKKE